ncbi:MAG: N-6 DNA methylase, partial [Verrucomicrobia bacterium]|nr:N-6 DNA methylase [Verrucomicrobiota bacterium]
MAVPPEILRLIERYAAQRQAYQSGQYKETQIRVEFIDPFFKALGWDVANEHGYAEAYKDVIHEDALKIGSATEAPDACFRIGGVRKFFVECKKPSVNIKDDVHPAYQLRRYGWSAKLPLSILTDFQEWAVYDCRLKPNPRDTAAVGRIMYLTADQYPAKWDELTAIFSREAVLTGSFDKFVESTKGKRGTASVDDAFLEEIERWRDLLARTIALRNPALSQRELNFAVQRTIDRIIFLRICEDRGIEPYGRLMTLKNGERIYPRLCEFFQRADERYNSGIFCFSKNKTAVEPPDELTLTLKIDDKIIQDIVGNLYYPESPYEFSVLSSDILGQVYERFLGKVIRLTAGHQAKVEEKPEVRKAGGVYYTPTFIVDYIVKNTVGKLLEGKTPKQAAKLKILDPACGSGSFLIGAYQYLLDWHRDYYVNAECGVRNAELKKNKSPIYQISGGDYRLTTEERKRILLNNIFGVDIDSQAVEVTKLSLLLKVLEGESQETITKQFELFHQRALPDLGSNIKCGNSLIGPDFYKDRQGKLFGEDEMFRINAFDWQAEFLEIMKSGGFDAVIGNPPWISLSGKFGNEIYSKEEIAYMIAHFQGNTYMPNMYEYFVAQGLNLARPSGCFSFIVPDRLGYNAQFVQLRRRILTEARIVSLLYRAPFPGITADTLVFVFHKAKPTAGWSVTLSEFDGKSISRNQAELLQHPTHAFEYYENADVMALIMSVSSCPYVKPLGQLCESTSGFGGKSNLIHTSRTNDREIPTLKGDSIGRYELKKLYWFDFRRENITGRTTDKTKLGAIQKILIRKTGDTIIATYDDSGVFPEQSLYFLFNNHTNLSLKYILGILNSRLLTTYYRAKSVTNKR